MKTDRRNTSVLSRVTGRALLVGAVVAGVSLVTPARAAAQTPVVWKARAGKTALRVGSTTHVNLSASIAPGWHIYSLTQGKGGPFPLRITVPANQAFVLAGSVEAPAPDVSFDNNFKIDVETYSDSVTFGVPLKLTTSAAATSGTTATASIAVRYQVCNATECLPPQTATLHVPIRVRHAVPGRVSQLGSE